MVLRQAEAALMMRCPRRVDRDDARGRLLLEPLAGVPRSDAGDAREVRCGDRPALVERAVEPEAPTERDRQQLGGGSEHADQLLGERAHPGGYLLLDGREWEGGRAPVLSQDVRVRPRALHRLGDRGGQGLGHRSSLRRRVAGRMLGTRSKSTPRTGSGESPEPANHVWPESASRRGIRSLR